MTGLDVLYNDHQKKFLSVYHGLDGGRSKMKKVDFFKFFQIFLPRTPDRSGASQILGSQIVGLIKTVNLIAQSTLSDQG